MIACIAAVTVSHPLDVIRLKLSTDFCSKFENKFYSSELLVKHDENYMPPEVAKDLKMKMPISN